MRALALLLLPLALPAAADEPPPALIEATEAALALCREQGGTPEILPDYQLVRDLNGDSTRFGKNFRQEDARLSGAPRAPARHR